MLPGMSRMRLAFWGFLFALLDLRIGGQSETVDGVTTQLSQGIDLLPDTLGWLLVGLGMSGWLAPKEFGIARNAAFAALVISIADYIPGLKALAIVQGAVELAVVWFLCLGIERTAGVPADLAARARMIRIVDAVLTVFIVLLTALLVVGPGSGAGSIVAVLTVPVIVVGLFVMVFLLLLIHRAAKEPVFAGSVTAPRA